MALLNLVAEMTGVTSELTACRVALVRIAEALERISPPLPASAPTDSAADSSRLENAFYMAESPEEYQVRTSAESDFVTNLGFAPWSPHAQELIAQLRSDLMRTKFIVGEDGERQEQTGLSASEADVVIKDAFRIARAEEEANRR